MPTTNITIVYKQSGKGLGFASSSVPSLDDTLQVIVKPADGDPPARDASLGASSPDMSFDKVATLPGRWTFSVRPDELGDLRKADSELILSVWLGDARHEHRIKLPPPSSTTLAQPLKRTDKLTIPFKPEVPRRPESKEQGGVPQGRRVPH